MAKSTFEPLDGPPAVSIAHWTEGLFGFPSPVGCECSDRVIELTDFIGRYDAALLERFVKSVKNNGFKKDSFSPDETAKLHKLDNYLNIPIIDAKFNPSIKALERMIVSNLTVPIEYLVPGYISGDLSICDYAAKNGHLEVIQFAHTNGCPWDSDTCANAEENGHLEVLKFARANGCPWDSDTCANAEENGHLEVLKFARANGCTWDPRTCSNAAENGHLEVLKWVRANGCPE